MHITSWNVNGIRAVEKKGLIEFLKSDKPDIFCVQETKANPEQLTQSLLSPLGYTTYWNSAEKKGYSGTAIFSKIPLKVQEMNITRFDNEGRVLIAEVTIASNPFILINAYFPNSQNDGQRLEYKLDFCNEILLLCNSITKPLLLCGDYNIAHNPIDLARPKENENSPGYLPEERKWMTKFLDAGYIDTFRYFNQEPHTYTWWSYRAGSRERNVGWRIDYFCTNKKASPFIKKCIHQTDVFGSDHCPVSIDIT